MKENQEKKKKYPGRKRRIFARVIAAIIACFMILAACSTCIFYLINS